MAKMKARYPEDKLCLVEKALRDYFPPEEKYPRIVYRAMKHSLFSGGKRFRPVLALTSCEAFGGQAVDVLPTACAIEYIHTYSLIHDDLPSIDNDALRRGQPTCHVVFGEDVALLAGDALFAEAFHLIASEQKAENPGKVVQIIEEISRASGVRGMVGGQVVDIKSSGREVKPEILKYIHNKKTGELIKVAARAGAIVAGASSEELIILTEYAHHLGLAFQITDDILDVVGESAMLGKAVGGDEKLEKVTFPGTFGLEKSKRLAAQEVEAAKKVLEGLTRHSRPLAQLAQFVYERES